MVYLFSLRFEDDARALTPRSPKETQGERALFPTEDRRRDHFPVLCCMRAERHLASIPQGSGAEHVAISVRQCPQLNWIVDPPRMSMSDLGQKQTSRHVRVMSVIPLKADIRQREWHVRYVPKADVLP
jgi:hypothetical protein